MRQWKRIRRAQFRLQQGLEYDAWLENELYPEIEAMKANKAIPQYGLLAGEAIQIVVERANLNPPPSDDSEQ